MVVVVATAMLMVLVRVVVRFVWAALGHAVTRHPAGVQSLDGINESRSEFEKS
jgi:hypothetical protein